MLGGGGITGASFEMATLMALELATGWSPDDAEVLANPRAASAKLRAVERIRDTGTTAATAVQSQTAPSRAATSRRAPSRGAVR